MWRGGGVDQPLLLQLARKAVGSEGGQPADWIHVYPEAGVYQWKFELGGRRNDRQETIGKLKWGVGKLIAHHPTNLTRYALTEGEAKENNSPKRQSKAPIVIPFYFLGTETITPFDDPINRKVQKTFPQFGQRVVLRFGEPMMFDDLLEEFEREEVRTGHVEQMKDALRVYTCCDDPFSPRHHSPPRQPIEEIMKIFNQTVERILPQTSLATKAQEESKEQEKVNEEQEKEEKETRNNQRLMYDLATWKSTPQEKKLYHQITRRIEKKLEELGEKCAQDMENE
jgi:hypothetical protein